MVLFQRLVEEERMRVLLYGRMVRFASPSAHKT